MLLDRSHKRWLFAVVAIAIVAAAAYVPYARSAPNGPSGGSWPGLIYGVAGFGLMLYAGALGLRRKVPTWRLGRASAWTRGHLWLGLLSYVLVLYHGAFQWGGPLTVVLMALFTVVIASGIYGVVLQQFIPRVMFERLPLETVYEQIDSIVAQLRQEADGLVAAAAGPLPIEEPPPGTERRGGGGLGRQEVLTRASLRPAPTLTTSMPDSAALSEAYLIQIRPHLARELPRGGPLAEPRAAEALFNHLRTVLPPALHDVVGELEAVCDERRQLALQKRLHHWLHGWLLVHVPLSTALLLLALVHAVISLRY